VLCCIVILKFCIIDVAILLRIITSLRKGFKMKVRLLLNVFN